MSKRASKRAVETLKVRQWEFDRRKDNKGAFKRPGSLNRKKR